MPPEDDFRLFEWNPELSVGVESIDSEHRKMLGLVETLHRAMFAGKGKDILLSLLADMIEFAQTHFAHEEALMTRIAYPGLEEQRGEHAWALGRLRARQARALAGETTMTIETAQNFADWMKRHMVARDRLIGEYLKSRNARQRAGSA